MAESELDRNRTDLLASTAKSILGSIPFAGPLIAEIVGNIIPSQRIDRLSKYVVVLEKKLADLSLSKIDELLQDEECVSLFEEGFIQASRATTKDRWDHIASVVSGGLDDESIAYTESKYLLMLLQELNELEVIWLRYYLHPTFGGDEEFREKHKVVLEPIHVLFGVDRSLVEKAALQDSYKEHLERLGLISTNISIDYDTGLPEFDRHTGKPKPSNTDTTPLGDLLLRKIGLIRDDE